METLGLQSVRGKGGKGGTHARRDATPSLRNAVKKGLLPPTREAWLAAVQADGATLAQDAQWLKARQPLDRLGRRRR